MPTRDKASSNSPLPLSQPADYGLGARPLDGLGDRLYAKLTLSWESKTIGVPG